MSDKKQMQMLIDQFDSFGFYLDDKLDRDIEENRKGAFSLSFTDENGAPLQNVKLKIKQISHEFKFGCNTFYLDQSRTRKEEELTARNSQIFSISPSFRFIGTRSSPRKEIPASERIPRTFTEDLPWIRS